MGSELRDCDLRWNFLRQKINRFAQLGHRPRCTRRKAETPEPPTNISHHVNTNTLCQCPWPGYKRWCGKYNISCPGEAGYRPCQWDTDRCFLSVLCRQDINHHLSRWTIVSMGIQPPYPSLVLNCILTSQLAGPRASLFCFPDLDRYSSPNSRRRHATTRAFKSQNSSRGRWRAA